MTKTYAKSSSLTQAGDNRFEGIWKVTEVLGDSEVLVLPSKVLINFECGCGGVLKLKELLASFLKVIAGDISLFLYGNAASWEKSLFNTERPLRSTATIFGLTVDSIGTSFPST